MNVETIYSAVLDAGDEALEKINNFTKTVMIARGSRIGSGMGLLFESLWGFYVNRILRRNDELNAELAWFPFHQFHDYACVKRSEIWNHENRAGEWFRIEAKSMNLGADESKAHFDVLIRDLSPHDALLLLVWNWEPIDQWRFYPKVLGMYFGRERPLAEFRDQLHLARGGSFVDSKDCPDRCDPLVCTHQGEPLNAQGKRERLSGPESTRPSTKVSHAANFGGLIRMTKARSRESRSLMRKFIGQNEDVRRYLQFIHEHIPKAERAHLTKREWCDLGQKYGLNTQNKSIEEIQQELRETRAPYHERMYHYE